MTRIEKKLLYDISESIRTILDDYLEGLQSLEQYEADLKTQDAVERRLLVIAEALYRLRRKGINLPFVDQIINRRNTVAHQYDEYNPIAI